MDTETRNALEEISRSASPLPEGVEGAVRSIHSDPALREWVTLESLLLAPVPFRRDGKWSLIGLLCRPVPENNGAPAYLSPWGAVEWEMPARGVSRTLTLSDDPETRALQALGPLPVSPASPVPAGDLERVEKDLWTRLDAFFAAPGGSGENRLRELADLYSKQLPRAAYPYYWSIAPGSVSWLQPETDKDTDTAPPAGPNRGAPSLLSVPTATEPERPALPPELPLIDPDSAPQDLSDQLNSWLAEAQALASQVRSAPIANALADLSRYEESPDFRVAFVGEFSRGKSTLLNRLFGRELLPVGVVPVTAFPTVIAPGAPDGMVIRHKDGSVEKRAIGAWDGLVAEHDGDSEAATADTIRLTVNDRWLESLRADLVDTPGVNDIDARRAALVIDTLVHSDVAVVVLSAIQALTMTEAEFIEQQVLGRRVPRVLVVVSRLDLLPLEKRAEMLDYVSKRVAQIAPGITVLPLAPVIDGESDAAVIDRVRSEISRMSTRNDRRAWRSHQIAARIADHVHELERMAKEQGEVARLNSEQRSKRIAEAKSNMRLGELSWEAILLELADRRRSHEQTFRGRLEAAKPETLENLLYDLSLTPDPKTWWERDLPFRLRRELAATARLSEQSLTQLIAADYDWLQATVKQRIGFDTTGGGQTPVSIAASELSLAPKDLADISRYRLLSRVGLGLTAAAGMLLLGPIGIAVSAGIGVISETTLNRRVEDQKKALANEVDRSIDRVIDESCAGFGRRLSDMYATLVDDIRKLQAGWQQARITALEQVTEDGRETANAREAALSASALSREILKQLHGAATN